MNMVTKKTSRAKKPKTETLETFLAALKEIMKYGGGPTAEREALELVKSKFGDVISEEETYDIIDGRKRLVGDFYDPKIERVDPPCTYGITGTNGWLSPQGQFYPCKYHQHSWLASIIWRNEKECYDERTLETQGWVKVQNGGWDEGTQWFFHYSDLEDSVKAKRPTEIQRRMVRDFCLLNLKPNDSPYWAEERF